MDGMDFTKDFQTMSVEDLFYRGDDGDKDALKGKYDENGNPIEGGDDKGGKDKGAPAGDGGDGGNKPAPGDGDGTDDGGDKTVSPVSSVLNGKSFLEKMAKRGLIDNIDDLDIRVDDQPVDLSTINKEDDLLDIVEGLIKDKMEESLKDKVDTSSMSDFMRQMIEVDKAGGNVGQLLAKYQNIQAPLENLDLNDKKDQLSVIKHYYKMLGMPDDEIKDSMELMASKDDEFIESKANKFYNILKKEMENMVKEEKEKSEKRKQELMEQMKVYRKGLRASVSSSFQLTDNMVGKAVDFVTKAIDDRGHTAIDKAYTEAIKNPDTAAELAMFLMNREEYLKQKTNKVKMETNKRTITLLSSSKGGKQGKTDVGGEPKEGFMLDIGD